MNVIGGDLGTHGGLAVVAIEDGAAPRLVDAIDVPVIGEGAKGRIDAIAIRAWVDKHDVAHAYLERAQAAPGQGTSNGFKYGRAVGSIETAIALSGIAATIVEPSAWRKFHCAAGTRNRAGSARSGCSQLRTLYLPARKITLALQQR